MDPKRLSGDVEYVETDEEEKDIQFAQLVKDRQIALSESCHCSYTRALHLPTILLSSGTLHHHTCAKVKTGLHALIDKKQTCNVQLPVQYIYFRHYLSYHLSCDSS